jgi:hypothetical protein
MQKLIPSFANIMRRFHSPVSPLMKSCAPISRFDTPSRGEAGDPLLPRYEAVDQRGSASAGTGRPPGLDMHDSSKDEARR